MRISDWSSDVCSSDLNQPREPPKRKTRGCRHPRTLACSIRRRNDFRRRSGAFHPQAASSPFAADRKSVVEGKSVSVRVDLGGRRIIKKKKKRERQNERRTG